MTINTTHTSDTHIGNSATTAFPITFQFYSANDIVVLFDDGVNPPVNQNPSNYIITGGNGSTGTITFTVAPPAGIMVVVNRIMTLVQQASYTRNDPFPSATHEIAIDRIVMMVQQVLTGASAASSVTPEFIQDVIGTMITFSASTGIVFDYDDALGIITAIVTAVGIEDVPSDSKYYVRRNAEWIEDTWANIVNKPTTFSPATHTHIAVDVTDFVSATQDTVAPMLNHSGHTNLAFVYDSVTKKILGIAVGSSGSTAEYLWNEATTLTDPGAGKIAINNANLDAATHVLVSSLDNDGQSTNFSTALIGDTIVLNDQTAAAFGTYLITAITYGTQFIDFTVTVNASLSSGNPTTLDVFNASLVVTNVSAGISDVPADGVNYGRKNTVWSLIDWTDVVNKPGTFSPSSHTHVSSDVTDFSEAVDDRVGNLIIAGSGIDVNYNDTAGTLEIEALGDTAAAVVSDTAPGTPNSGDLWWNSLDATLYVWYDDGSSAQWVIAIPVYGNEIEGSGANLTFSRTSTTVTILSDTGSDAVLPAASATDAGVMLASDKSKLDGLNGAAYQPIDTDLTTLAALVPTTDNFIQSKSGAWESRTPAQVKTDLGLVGTNSGDQVSFAGILGGNWKVFYTDGSGVITELALGSSGTFLQSNGATSAPTWVVGGGGSDGLGPDGDKGDITVGGVGTTLTIDNGAVTLAKMANIATESILGRITAATGIVEVLTPAQVKTLLALVKADVGLGNVDNTSDVNKPVSTAQQTALDGKQTIDSDLTTIAGLVATTDNFLQSKASAWASRTPAQVKTDLGLTGTNSGDQTSIVGITGTKAQFDTAVSDGNIQFVGDMPTAHGHPQADITNLVTDLSNKQPLDTDLTTIAGLTATTDNFIQSKSSAWASRTPTQVKTDLGLTGTNSGDQTTIVGITGTKAQFDTANTDGNFSYIGNALTADHVGGNWKVFYTNGSGVITELALGGAGTILQANGASSAPTWVTPAGGSSVTISDTAPGSPIAGDMWWNSLDATLYVYYNDGTSSQWVIAIPVYGNEVNGFVEGPASVTDDLPAVFDGTTGKLIKEKTYAAFKTLLALVKADVGLDNVDNTADANKPVSTAQQTELDLKVTGPASATADALALFNGTTGKIIKSSGITVNANGEIVLVAGGTGDAPLKFTAGTNLTTPEDGAAEFDGVCFYLTGDAGNRGVVLLDHYCRLAAEYTLTNSTTEQKLFNSTANGRLTLETGAYTFECTFALRSMSTTSGNCAFDILGAGSAVLADVLYQVIGIDGVVATVAAQNGAMNIQGQTAASMVTAGTGAECYASIRGSFAISTAGTIVPSVGLVTAAAAIVRAGSYFKCRRIGALGSLFVGQWD